MRRRSRWLVRTLHLVVTLSLLLPLGTPVLLPPRSLAAAPATYEAPLPGVAPAPQPRYADPMASALVQGAYDIPGITVYTQRDVNCVRPQYTPVVPYRTKEGAGMASIVFYICSQGALVHVKLLSYVQGYGGAWCWTALECCYSSMGCWPQECRKKFTEIIPPAIYYPLYGPNCGYYQSAFEGDIYLPPGEYVMRTEATSNVSCTPLPARYKLIAGLSKPGATAELGYAPEDGCKGTCPQARAAHGINTRTGNFTHQEADFSISTRGLPLTFERSYNALDTAAGPLGQGWTHSYNMRLITGTYSIQVVAPRGSRLSFFKKGDGTFLAGPGVRGSLVKNADGTYTYSQPDQVVQRFDADGRLLWLEDSRGNRTTLSYTSGNLTAVTAPDGRSLTLSYDQGRLAQVTDPLSRTVRYAYTDGRLTGVTDPAGQTRPYAYNAQGRMETLTDANGATLTNEYDSQGRVTLQRDKLGQATRFAYSAERTVITDTAGIPITHTYNEQNALVAFSDALGKTTSYEYDDRLNLTASTDPLGNRTSYTWSSCGCKLATVTDTLGNVTRMTYDAHNNLLSVTDPLTHTTRYAYDAYDNLRVITNTLGITATFTYDSYGLLTASTDARGHRTQYGYDAYGNLAVVTDTLGHVTTMAYDAAGRLLATTDANRRTTHLDYDALGRLITTTDALGGETVLAYDAVGHVTGISDANHKATRFAYDAAGRLITTTDALGAETVRAYDPLGHLTRLTDGNGKTTRYAYDAAGRLITVTDALDGRTVYHYDAAGNVTRITDAQGQATTLAYDALNRTVAITDTLGHATWYGYDAVGNWVFVRDPTGVLIQYSYDALSRLRTATGPLGTLTAYDYDPAGNLTTLTDGNGHVTRYTYDPLDRLETALDPLDGLTVYGYDPAGNLTTVADANGHATQRAYDALSRLIAVTDPLSHTTRYGYDAVGNTTVITDAGGGVTVLSYDDGYRLTQVEYPDATVGYTYDAAGNRLSLSDATGTTRYDYDDLYRPLTITAPLVGAVGYRYDALGRRTETRYPTGERVSYGYDDTGRLARVTDWADQETTYIYDAAGRLLQVERPNGVETQYAYDAAGRLVRVQHSDWRDWLAGYEYALDAVGNRVGVTETVSAILTYGLPALGRPANAGGGAGALPLAAEPEPGEEVISYRYDAADRLTGATYAGGEQYAYAYDPVGNRTALTVTTPPSGTQVTTYAYDDADRLMSVDGLPVMYDDRGNQLTDGPWTYTYDGAGRMVRAETISATQVYTYNGDGLLVAQEIDGVETVFAWDQALELPQVLATSDGMKSLYGLDRIGVLQASAWRYPLPDALGSVRQWTDPAGAVLATQSYGPFGEAREPLGIPPWGFTGEWHDPNGMQYLRTRWYTPTLGRFTQVDPVAGSLVAPVTQHSYVYGLNNPLTYGDHDGRQPRDPEEALDWLYFAWNIGSAIGTGLQILIYGRTEARVEKLNTQLAAVGMSALALAIPGTTAAGPRIQGNGSAGALVCETAGSPQVAKALVRAGQAYVSLLLLRAASGTGAGSPPGGSGAAGSQSCPDGTEAKNPRDVFDSLSDGEQLTSDEVLQAGRDFLGEGYSEVGGTGSGVFVSKDGTRMFRITTDDITGTHGAGPHANFQYVIPAPKPSGGVSYRPIPMMNKHVYIK